MRAWAPPRGFCPAGCAYLYAIVYLLRSLKDLNRYIGSTIDLDKRLNQHFSGQVKSTVNRRPLILEGYQKFETIKEAALYEKKYKRSHGTLERMIKSGKFILDEHRGVV